jgi:hypothetical protein
MIVIFYDLLKYHQNFREIAPSLQAVGTVFVLSLSLSLILTVIQIFSINLTQFCPGKTAKKPGAAGFQLTVIYSFSNTAYALIRGRNLPK